MAISTINEKHSLISLLKPWEVPLPVSADDLGQDDKQHLLWAYSGILWLAFGEIAITITSSKPGITITSSKPGITITHP